MTARIQNRKIQLTETSHHTQENTNTYICGCACQLPSRDRFKTHVINKHNGKFIKGSSHYLSIITQIVLPVKNWNKLMASSQSRLQQSTEEDVEICKLKSSKEIPEEKRVRNKLSNKTFNFSNNENLVHSVSKISSCRKQNTMTQKRIKRDKKKIEWNGFSLIPNQIDSMADFYCGKCKKLFQTAQDFVTHCLDQCEELQNPESSHMIEIGHQQKQIRTQNDQQAKIDTPQNTIRQAYRMQFNSPQHKHIKNFIFNEKEFEPFVCGCGFIQKSSMVSCTSHLKTHQEIVPPNSSHIILRKARGQIRIILARLRVDTKNGRQNFYCPCKPEKFMQAQPFITHILKIHKGMSPIYY